MKKLTLALSFFALLGFYNSQGSVIVSLNPATFNSLIQDYLATQPYLVIVEKKLNYGPATNLAREYMFYKDGFYFRSNSNAGPLEFGNKTIVVPATSITTNTQTALY